MIRIVSNFNILQHDSADSPIFFDVSCKDKKRFVGERAKFREATSA
jgi:hypothetical protein